MSSQLLTVTERHTTGNFVPFVFLKKKKKRDEEDEANHIMEDELNCQHLLSNCIVCICED